MTAPARTQSGYLTEPYKLISLMDPATGVPVGQLTDQRPTSRSRNSLLASSAYHFTRDILYSSYRYYWDSWDVQSHTLDFKYRHDLADDWYVEPDPRFYQQSAANFYVGGLVDGAPLPAFATADYRLGDLIHHHRRRHVRVSCLRQPLSMDGPCRVHPPGRGQLPARGDRRPAWLRPGAADRHDLGCARLLAAILR